MLIANYITRIIPAGIDFFCYCKYGRYMVFFWRDTDDSPDRFGGIIWIIKHSLIIREKDLKIILLIKLYFVALDNPTKDDEQMA